MDSVERKTKPALEEPKEVSGVLEKPITKSDASLIQPEIIKSISCFPLLSFK
jgi:hypothetical protein